MGPMEVSHRRVFQRGADTTIFVGKLGSSVSAGTVEGLVRACGEVKSIRAYLDATKGFVLATFVNIQGVYLAKKLLESVVLHGQKVVVNCNRATTARLKAEKFKYGQEEREEETKVKEQIEALVEACNRDEKVVEQDADATNAANDFLESLLDGSGREGGSVEERKGVEHRQERSTAAKMPSFQKRFDLMRENEKSRLARLEKETDRRRDLVQERQRQVLADNEGVGDPRETWPLHERKAYRNSREHIERKKRNVRELEEDEKEAARMMSHGGRDGGGEGREVQTGRRDAVAREASTKAMNSAATINKDDGNTRVRKTGINFEEDQDDARGGIQREAALAGDIMQRLPKTMDQLNSYPIKWDVFDGASKAVHTRISEWIAKKIADLLGEEEEFVEFIFEGVRNHKHPRDLVADVQDVLDEDTDAFVIELYGKVIFEIEKLQM